MGKGVNLGFTIVLTSVLLMTTLACGSSPEVENTVTTGPEPPGAPLVVRGHVVSVEAETIADIKAFAVEDGEGVLWSFIVQGRLELTPSHLREHQLLGLPVVVTYQETTDGLLAVSVLD